MKRLNTISFYLLVLTIKIFALPANADFGSRLYIGSVDEIKNALENGNDVNEDLGDGMRPLMAASSMNSIIAIKFLIYVGAHLNDQERKYGQTALMFALPRDDPDIIELLIDSGADPFIKDNYGDDILSKIEKFNSEKIKNSKIYAKILSMMK